MKTFAIWLYQTFPILQDWFPIPVIFLLALYALAGLFVLLAAGWLLWKLLNCGLDSVPDPVHPVIQRVVVVHEHRHSRIGEP